MLKKASGGKITDKSKSCSALAPSSIPYRRTLWKKPSDSFDDSTLPPDFLKSLTINENLTIYSYKDAVQTALKVAKQISSVVFFAVVFQFCYTKTIPEHHLLFIDGILLINGLLIRKWRDKLFTWFEFVQSVRRLLLLGIALLALAPILLTLTSTISNDTIWSSAVLLMVVHLYLFDYDLNYLDVPVTKITSPISNNAPIFASVLLGSRLESPLGVFALVFFAVQFFALFPVFRHHMKQSQQSNDESGIAGVLMSALIIPLLWNTMGRFAAILFLGVISILTLVFPYLFVRMQKYKRVIHGDWDEAVPAVQGETSD